MSESPSPSRSRSPGGTIACATPRLPSCAKTGMQRLLQPRFSRLTPSRNAMRILARIVAFLALLQVAIQPVAAQGILRDAETEDFLQELMDPLTVAAGMPVGSVDVVLLQDPSINAFVEGGQRIYVHSGLIEAADTANEVQGVL